MAKLKVFSGMLQGRGKPQVVTCVATTSKKELAGIIGCTVNYINEYWSETGNVEQVKAALSKPGAVFQASTSTGTDFIEVSLRGHQ